MNDNGQNVHMMTLTCLSDKCHAKVRIGRILNQPVAAIGTFQFCPLCGSEASTFTETDETVWEAWSRAHNLDIDILRVLYELWNPHTHQRFGDFVNERKKVAGLT